MNAIGYETSGHVAYVTLDRPERMNALDPPTQRELIEVFDEFARDEDAWVAIITGTGDRAFCAGNDLKAAMEITEASKRFGAITFGYDCPKPIIAAVNGAALGGGFEIVLACDIVVAADTACFGLPEPRIGMLAAAGGVHRLARQIPVKQAMGMVLTGRTVDAEEGHRLGFVNEVVPAAELRAAAQRWAAAIVECSPFAVRLAKEAVTEGLGKTVPAAIASDWDERIPRLLASPDFAEGPRAFAEKRAPVWSAG